MLGELPSPIMEEPLTQRGIAPASPRTPRAHPSADRSLEAKATKQAAAALQSEPLLCALLLSDC